MFDRRVPGGHFNEPCWFAGRFAGANANAPVTVASVPDSTSTYAKMVRNNVGNYTLTLYDGVNPYNTNQVPVGTIQFYEFSITQPQGTTGANMRDVNWAPPIQGANNWVFPLQVFQFSNSSNNQDLLIGEELTFYVLFSQSVRP